VTDEQKRAALVEEAKTWLGTPFHHRAAVKGAGVDCAFFIYATFHAVGLVPELEFPDYSPQWWANRNDEWFIECLEKEGLHEFKGPLEPGDVVVVKYGRVFAHGAIIIDWPKIVHASPLNHRVQIDSVETHLLFVQRPQKYFTLFGAPEPCTP
jgi:cell wall-associated NlpC family hydrolase